MMAPGTKMRLWTIVGGCLFAAALLGFSPYCLRELWPGKTAEPFFPGLSDYSRKITTSSELAQRYFDQGLLLLYAYNDEEAARSFQAAADADPDCAMAYWGIAVADRGNGYDILDQRPQTQEGFAAARRAEELASSATPVEQALIRAIVIRFRELTPLDKGPLKRAYASAMHTAWQRFPDDADVASLAAEAAAQVFTGQRLWTPDGKLDPDAVAVLGPLDAALAKDPNHLFALHQYIHMAEKLDPQKAQFAADRLRKLSPPGLGHLLHMPSHIDIQMGHWDDALAANERAIAADREYALLAAPQDGYRYLMEHNQHMLAYAAAMQGMSGRATHAIHELLELMVPEYVARKLPVVDYYFAMPYELHVRFGEWDAMLNEPRPSEDFAYTRAMWHFGRGVACAAKHRMTEARFERQQLGAVIPNVPAGTLYHKNSAAAVLAVDDAMLDGEILYREGKPDEALDRLNEAISLEDNLGYAEPPDLFQPVRQVQGAVLMDLGRYAQAEPVYREDLRRHPENGWSLYGLSRSLKKQGENAVAAAVAARFEKVWKHADIKLTASCLCLPEKD
jgi:tetratricopeptide (TPR) repeat protein